MGGPYIVGESGPEMFVPDCPIGSTYCPIKPDLRGLRAELDKMVDPEDD